MKKLLLFIMLICSISAYSTVYYFSTTGSDSNDGLSTDTPKQTLIAANALSLVGGDQVLFKKGDQWYGTLIINESGTSGNPITYGAYGTGANPVITGFTQVTAWTNLGSNIWESTNAVSTLTTCNMVAVDGVSVRMGREPDTGFYYYQSHTNSPSTITSTDLDGVINWTGAEVALVLWPWTIGRDHITAQSGSTITYTKSGTDVNPYQDNQRFIIQNDERTLDVQNEWYFNPSTKKLKIYSTFSPVNIKVSTVEKLVDLVGYNHITIQGITFNGANTSGFNIDNCDNLTISTCTIAQNGFDGVYGINNSTSPNLIIEDCVISDNNHVGIGVSDKFTNATIRRNTVTNSGMIFGSGRYPVGILNNIGAYIGVGVAASGSLIEQNTVTNSGYHGIAFYLNNSIVQKNSVNTFCKTVIDGAGIYTWGSLTPTVYSGMKVLDNIIINDAYIDNGIYLDDLSNNIIVQRNTISKCNYGIYLHNTKNCTVRDNVCFDNMSSIALINNSWSTYLMTDNIVKKNKFIAKSTNQRVMWGDFIEKIIPTLVSDSNYWARPIDDNVTFSMFIRTPSFSAPNYTLSQWRTFSGQDANSNKSPFTIASENELLFIYNSTASDSIVSLPVKYKDLNGISTYSVTLQPQTSKILFRDYSTDMIRPIMKNKKWTKSRANEIIMTR